MPKSNLLKSVEFAPESARIEIEEVDSQYIKLLEKLETIISKIKERRNEHTSL
jgi:hypothetical protein